MELAGLTVSLIMMATIMLVLTIIQINNYRFSKHSLKLVLLNIVVLIVFIVLLTMFQAKK